MVYPYTLSRWSYGDHLEHHGIKGQQWGIRRFQNEDGTLTAEGRERYNIDDPKEATRAVTNAYNRYLRARKSKTATPEKKLMTKAEWLYKADKNYDVNIRKQINQEIDKNTAISKRRLALEKKFLEKGMTQKEAQIAAVKRERVENVLKIVGVAAATVAVAYASTKAVPFINRLRDRRIPKNAIVQNLSTDPTKGLENPFYAVFKNKDKKHYIGYFGGQHLRGNSGTEVYKMTAQAGSKMKVASERTGKKALNDLLKNDKDFRLAVEDTVNKDWRDYFGELSDKIQTEYVPDKAYVQKMISEGNTPAVANLFAKVRGHTVPAERDYLLSRLKNGKADRNFYEAVNTMLTSHGASNQVMNDKFYAKLKKMGYDAIVDVNDKYNVSRYRGTNPLIIFNPAKLINKQNEQIPRETMKTMVQYANKRVRNVDLSRAAKLVTTAYMKSYGTATLAAAGSVGMIYGASEADKQATYRKVINRYKEEHPNTKLTDSQILENELGA